MKCNDAFENDDEEKGKKKNAKGLSSGSLEGKTSEWSNSERVQMFRDMIIPGDSPRMSMSTCAEISVFSRIRKRSTDKRFSSNSIKLRKAQVQIEFDSKQSTPIATEVGELNSRINLVSHMVLSFGIVNTMAILFVVITCITVTILAKDKVKAINLHALEELAFKDLAIERQGTTAEFLSESLTTQMLPYHVVNILREATQDRYQGYPDKSDDQTPFFDVRSQRNRYPIVGKPLKLDWQIESNVNDTNYAEHLQDRWNIFKKFPTISTANCGFYMQGMCDPSVKDPTADTYYPNCSDAHNDILTGGVISPNPMTNVIYNKAKDLAPLLKALFETRGDLRDVAIAFANDGSGCTISCPHYPFEGGTYSSIGCDWMKTPNPYDPSKQIGTKEMINKCRPANTTVPIRLFNPMERQWCRDQALNPHKIHTGIHFDVWGSHWAITLGQSVYDRITKEFIGCIYVSSHLYGINEKLKESRIRNSEISLITVESPTVIASSVLDSMSNVAKLASISSFGYGLTLDYCRELQSLIDYTRHWDAQEVRNKYINFVRKNDRYYVIAHPMPPIPEEYDPEYKPIAFVVTSLPETDILDTAKEVDTKIDKEARSMVTFSLVCAAVFFVVTILIICTMAGALTLPLKDMNRVTTEILNHFGNSKEKTRISDTESTTFFGIYVPRTELHDMREEFTKMVASFSGSLMTKSERGEYFEIRNRFSMSDMFLELYAKRDRKDFEYYLSSLESKSGENTEFCHLGPNLISNRNVAPIPMDYSLKTTKKKSRFYVLTVLLIVIPLLCFTVIISSVVLNKLSKGFENNFNSVEESYVSYKEDSLSVHVQLRADYVAGLTESALNGLYLITRYSGWLLFGGLERPLSFTQHTSGIEECKAEENKEECGYVLRNHLCDCAWKEKDHDSSCEYVTNSRSLQKSFFTCESLGTQGNGDRNATSFPNTSYSSATTAWWDDVTKLPISKNDGSKRYDSTYDRMQVISALPLLTVIYNSRKEKKFTGSVAFEADGLYVGYTGCTNALSHVKLAQWESTKKNKAAQLRPELCPLGKYGYDPR